ncbi:MAG TPA: TonB-dependent receptor [Steroidobacteraceae bacterium]|nr:TonB-dependent receptor [Steroidobacteraceae bacterium]
MASSNLAPALGSWIFALAVLSLAEHPASAQMAETKLTTDNSLQEIVVTAEKREERLLDVPAAVSALSGNALAERHFDSIEDFTGAVPNLAINNYVGEARVTIRGIGQTSFSPAAEGSSAFHVNGVYEARPGDAAADFLDVDRIEVIRGPQGTLYGRNATGGSVNLITKRPTDKTEADLRLSFGNYDAFSTQAVVSGPLINDMLLGRIAYASEVHSGYSKNLYDGRYFDNQNAHSVRGTLVFNPHGEVTATIIGDYHEENDGDYATHFLGKGNPSVPLVGVTAGGSTIPVSPGGSAIDPRLLNVDSIPENKRHSAGVLADASWKISDSLSAKSISAYRNSYYFVQADLDATTTQFPTDIPGTSGYVQSEDAKQYSEELQLLGDSSRNHWIAGLYYFDEKVNPGYYDIGLGPTTAAFPLFAGGSTNTKAYAIFGQDAFSITDQISFTLGGRWSHETRSVDERWTSDGALLGGFGPCATLPGGLCHQVSDASFQAFTPKAVLEYKFQEGLMGYVSAGRGFKSGGYSLGDLGPHYQPEYVWAYEVGIKVRSDDGRLQANAAAFHDNYSNLQITEINNGILLTRNAATSKIDGLEFEGSALPNNTFEFTTALAYLHARFTQFSEADPAYPNLGAQDLEGNQLPNAPKYSADVTGAAKFPVGGLGVLRFSAEWSWRDKVYFTEFNRSNAEQPAVATVNAFARLTAPSDRWYVEVFGKNLANRTIVSQNFVSSGSFGFPRNGQLEPPRTWGAAIWFKFL